jgi:hypothetical protein
MLIVMLQLAMVAGALVAGWFIKSYFPSYLAEKGKNLATKEDIREITEKIEGVKEALGSRLHIHQVRYEQEFKILVELSEKLVPVRDAVLGLRPEVTYGDSDPNDPELKKKRVARYLDAARDLYTFVETRQPFFPETIYDTLKRFDQATWKEVVQYKNQTTAEGQVYWDNALKNGAEIGMLASAALLLIRARTQSWESFDPGP